MASTPRFSLTGGFTGFVSANLGDQRSETIRSAYTSLSVERADSSVRRCSNFIVH
jgi:hypothetical protein